MKNIGCTEEIKDPTHFRTKEIFHFWFLFSFSFLLNINLGKFGVISKEKIINYFIFKILKQNASTYSIFSPSFLAQTIYSPYQLEAVFG